MKVKANKELFGRIKGISYIVRDLGAIVQNDMEISKEDFTEFSKLITQCLLDIIKWQVDVQDFVMELNRKNNGGLR